MAAGTIERHAEHRLANGGDDVVETIVAGLLGIDRFIIPDAQAIEARCDQRVGIAGEKLIACQLFAQEAVERLILIEGTDDVIAIAPDVRLRVVALVAVGLGIADEVEPMPGPLFAVLRHCQQLVH